MRQSREREAELSHALDKHTRGACSQPGTLTILLSFPLLERERERGGGGGELAGANTKGLMSQNVKKKKKKKTNKKH